MPIYEYRCKACGQEFEKYVRSVSGAVEVVCPACGSRDCVKGFSLFGMSSPFGSSSSSGGNCAPSG